MNIQQITRELLDKRLTQQDLASRAGCSQSTISAFLSGKRGARPTLAIGMRLLDLHRELCRPEYVRDCGLDGDHID
ncbi:helix-turn-helix domain-containing protein [Massilia eburnea]|uniref:helix-turn-helix domain-containing protein n=1 Tax=Massilia eburnea TaxID=1776165 RepID=UPI003D6BFD75